MQLAVYSEKDNNMYNSLFIVVKFNQTKSEILEQDQNNKNTESKGSAIVIRIDVNNVTVIKLFLIIFDYRLISIVYRCYTS
jgi:hypothetical protein